MILKKNKNKNKKVPEIVLENIKEWDELKVHLNIL